MVHILDCTTFSLLDSDGQNKVRELHEKFFSGQPFEWDLNDTRDIARHRISLQSILSLEAGQLRTINPASFEFLSDEQKTALTNQLLFTFYCLAAQYHLDEIEHRREGLKDLSEHITTCSIYIQLLANREKKSFQAMLDEVIANSKKPARYLGQIMVSPLINESILAMSTPAPANGESTPVNGEFGSQMSSSKTGTTVKAMNAINTRRLYWVWGGGLLSSVLELFPDSVVGKQQAQQVVDAPSLYTGYMSWILYYTRFGISLGLLLKHTIAGSWMSEAEQNIPWHERFQTQWELRRFSLLNDLIWGFANMCCFYWLRGPGILGYIGNVVTAGLLLMDVSLNIWNLCYQSTLHNKIMSQYENDLQALNRRIDDIGEISERKKLEFERDRLRSKKESLTLEWCYKECALINDVSYAVGLLIAFAVVCCFFFPPASVAPTVTLIMGVVGAALCFLLTVACPAISGALDIHQTKVTANRAGKEYRNLLAKFGQETDVNMKKQLYLSIKQLEATDACYQQSIVYQRKQLIRSLLVDLFIPPLILGAFIFLPLQSGLFVLAAGFALAALSYKLLENDKPADTTLQAFNTEEYDAFVANRPEIPNERLLEPRFLPWQQGYQQIPNENGDRIDGENNIPAGT